MKTEIVKLTTEATKVTDGSTLGYITSNVGTFLFSIADTLSNAKGWHSASSLKVEKGMAVWLKTFNQADVNVAYVSTYKEDETSISVSGVVISNKTASVDVGSTVDISYTVSPYNANDKSVTFTSSDTSKATVTNAGKVTGVAAGTAKITVRTNDGGFSDTSVVTVNTVTP